jgi:hypothetical protein
VRTTGANLCLALTFAGRRFQVAHGVDIRRPLTNSAFLTPHLKRFHRIGFNFPHVGGSSAEDVKQNQTLLYQFFKTVAPFSHPAPQGLVLVTLRDTPFYNSWEIKTIAAKAVSSELFCCFDIELTRL